MLSVDEVGSWTQIIDSCTLRPKMIYKGLARHCEQLASNNPGGAIFLQLPLIFNLPAFAT
jgi:hypothetical protein